MEERRRIRSRVGEGTTIASWEKDREGAVSSAGGYEGAENSSPMSTNSDCN